MLAIQRQHVDLGITSTYLRGIDTIEIIHRPRTANSYVPAATLPLIAET